MTGLLEDVAHFRFFSVPDHTLAADDRSRPLLGEGDQLLTVERAAAEIYEGTDAVLFDLVRAVCIVVMMVVVMMSVMLAALMMIVIIIVVIVMMVVMFMLVIVVIIIVMVVMLVLIVVIIIVMVVMLVLIVIIIVMVVMLVFVIVVIIVVMIMLIFIVIIRILDGFDPAGRFHGLLKIETSCIEDIGDFDLGVVGFNDLGACLQAADDLFQKTELLRCDHVHFIEEDGVAELELLDEKILDIFFLDGILGQASAVLKFVVHARAVDDSDDVVKFHRKTCVGALLADVGDGLGDRDRLTDTGSLDDDVIILLCLSQLAKLVGKVVSQSAANAAICQRYKVTVLLCDDTTLTSPISLTMTAARMPSSFARM